MPLTAPETNFIPLNNELIKKRKEQREGGPYCN